VYAYLTHQKISPNIPFYAIGTFIMQPQEYFPKHYRKDLDTFCSWEEKEIPNCGPFHQLCGWTVGALFDPAQHIKFASPSDFICCTFMMNVLNQSLHSMHNDFYYEWCTNSEPFIDSSGCRSGHGGFTSAPNSVLRFANNPSYIPDAVPIEISDIQLLSYIRFFIYEYLKLTINPNFYFIANFESYLNKLKVDVDYSELNLLN